MMWTKISRFAPFGTVLVVLLVAVGCGRTEAPKAALPTVPTSRTEAPAFRKQMAQHAAGQNRTAARLAAIEEEMAAIRARTKKPEGDPKWSELVAARAACQQEMKTKLANTRADVRKVLLQQAADKAAVKAGKAQYAPAAKDK